MSTTTENASWPTLRANLLALSPETRATFIRDLSDEQYQAVNWFYVLQARDKQLPPPGDWFCWLLLSGRGFGKTRTGAEWVKHWAMTGPQHIAIVGQTKGDVRDTMVEVGESSILKISDPWFMPEYQPSKRRIVWPNGATATIYSGDEPGQLRGPQHDRAWVDELCLAAGTLIATEYGDMPIEQVKPGIKVRTRTGWKRVKHAGMTNDSAKVLRLETRSGRELIGTANHPVWVDGVGFTPLLYVKNCDILTTWDKASGQTSSIGADRSGTTRRTTITTVKAGYYTAPFTHRFMGRFRPAWIFTTSTETKRITTSRIWKRLTAPRILRFTGRKDGGQGRGASETKAAKLSGRPELGSRFPLLALFAGINSWAKASGRNIVRGLAHRKPHAATQRTGWNARVNSAARFIQRLSTSRVSFAPVLAQPSGLIPTPGITPRNKGNAPFAKKTSRRQTRALFVVQESADISLNRSGHNRADVVKSVVELDPPTAVFNLEVEDDHEYFANGILVHNSKFQYPQETWDMLELGLRLGERPQVVVTSTPRPIRIIKRLVADAGTVMTTGSTYENQDNLSPAFIQRIKERYENTRLGQQELHGRILDDDPRALWGRDALESSRVTDTPDLSRIVVAVDPHATSGQTGIIVVGEGWINKQRHIYTLDDVTPPEGAKPDQWGTAAVAAYHKWNADALVGEINNGGDMVEHVIRTMPHGGQVRYVKVRATRGKYTRAEPISALWEQGRGHMVGYYPDLEDQLCTYVPGETDSPDRLDALVWGATMLIDSETPVAGVSHVRRDLSPSRRR